MSEIISSSPLPAEPPPSAPATAPSQKVFQPLLTACSCIAAALIILAAAEWDYSLALRYQFLRTDCLLAGIAAALGATACLAGAIYYLNRALATHLRWYWKALLATSVRLFMLLQLLTMALALGAAFLLIFDKPLPGTARESMIQRLAPGPTGVWP